MPSGGSRRGAERPKGSHYDQVRLGLRAAVRRRLVEVIEAGDDPLRFLAGVTRDVSVDFQTRVRVAQFLMSYCHPRQYGRAPQMDDAVQRVSKQSELPT